MLFFFFTPSLPTEANQDSLIWNLKAILHQILTVAFLLLYIILILMNSDNQNDSSVISWHSINKRKMTPFFVVVVHGGMYQNSADMNLKNLKQLWGTGTCAKIPVYCTHSIFISWDGISRSISENSSACCDQYRLAIPSLSKSRTRLKDSVSPCLEGTCSRQWKV